MISIQNVSKSFGKNSKVVDSLTWEVKDGSITGFIGPNGAGKTTTLKMITGILRPDTGSISINGIDILQNPIEAKRQFAFVPDSPDYYLSAKGIEYLNFMADIYGVSEADRKNFIDDYAVRFEIADKLGNKIGSYSHGMRQKIMVLGALIRNPSVWILDEPLTGLDPKAAFTLKELMKEHAAAGNSVLFSTHVLEVAEKLCDQIAILVHGQKIYDGTLDRLKESYPDTSLEDIFLKMTGFKKEGNEQA